MFRSYLTKPYDERLFKPVVDAPGINKMKYGLWACTITDQNTTAWHDWCEGEMPYAIEDSIAFNFRLKKGCRFLVIDDFAFFEKFASKYKRTTSYMSYISFEEVSVHYDALFISQEVVDEYRMANGYLSLYSWDVESLVVFNKDVVEEII